MERNVLADIMIQPFERYRGVGAYKDSRMGWLRVVLTLYKGIMRNQRLLTSRKRLSVKARGSLW